MARSLLPPALPEAGPPVLAPHPAHPSSLATPACPSAPPPPCLRRHCSCSQPSSWPWGPPCPGGLPSSSPPSGHLPLTCRPRGPWGPRAASKIGGGWTASRWRAPALWESRTEGAKQRHWGSPPPTTVPPALPPLSAGGEGGLLFWQRDPGPGPPCSHRGPSALGPSQARVRGQLCRSTSRAHTLPAVPWIMGREGSGGREATPQPPWNHPRVPGTPERAGWGGGIGPFTGKETSARLHSPG